MKLLFRVLMILIPVSAALATIELRSGRRHLAEWLTWGPVADFPSVVDAGEQQSLKTFQVGLTIGNRGSADLVIDNLHSDCSCSGLGREKDGEFVGLASLHLAPGERADLQIRAIVKGFQGESRRHAITFDTNDPARRAGRIELLVSKILSGLPFTRPQWFSALCR
jgi:hypothetical protein